MASVASAYARLVMRRRLRAFATDDRRGRLVPAGKGGSAFEEAVEQVLEAVKAGAVPPGDQLPPERELALQLNVSRVTLREAIRTLAQAGYVESRRGRAGGTFVVYQAGTARPPQRDRRRSEQLEDALAFRAVVESGAVDLVARRRLGRAEREVLGRELDEVNRAPLGAYRQADSRLHLLVAELSGSALLTRAVADVRMRVNDLLDALPALEQPLVHSNVQHTQIVEAILARDPVAARQAMDEHLEATAALLPRLPHLSPAATRPLEESLESCVSYRPATLQTPRSAAHLTTKSGEVRHSDTLLPPTTLPPTTPAPTTGPPGGGAAGRRWLSPTP